MSTSPEPFDRLPEFPDTTFESLGRLRRSERGPFVTLEPRRLEVPLPRRARPVDETRSSHATRNYYAWATYPSVVCHDPGPLVDDLRVLGDVTGVQSAEQPAVDLGEVAREVRHYRLTTFEGKQLPRPFWCNVTYGPWLAFLKETESCIVDDPNRWELYIYSPEVAVVWFGSPSDMPQVPGLTVVWGTMVPGKAEAPSACPGYFWCSYSNEFKRTGEPCGPISPV